MKKNDVITFTSFFDFLKRFINIFRGPTFISLYSKLNPVLRQKLFLVVSMSNNCYGWVTTHSAVGRKKGITNEEISALIKLNKNDFEYKEWIALSYAREWTFARGENVPNELKEEFSKYYSKKEQALITKLLNTMLFINYFGNGVFKRPWRTDESCSINSEITK
jgi:AhpD family alkylhydroperoxidase